MKVNNVANCSIGSIFVSLKMNDGSIYSSAEKEERAIIDDTIMIDIGDAYTCNYAGVANNNAQGVNVTMAVVGPYNAGDRVEVMYRTSSGSKGYLLADYRRPRDAYTSVSWISCSAVSLSLSDEMSTDVSPWYIDQIKGREEWEISESETDETVLWVVYP